MCGVDSGLDGAQGTEAFRKGRQVIGGKVRIPPHLTDRAVPAGDPRASHSDAKSRRDWHSASPMSEHAAALTQRRSLTTQLLWRLMGQRGASVRSL